MLIRKEFQGELPENKIVNAYSDSQTDTYSCEYINDEIYYKPGDTFSFNYTMVLPGLITSSKSGCQIGIVLPKKLNYISSITINTLKANIRITDGGYLDTTAFVSGGKDYLSGYTTKAVKVSDNMVYIDIAKSSAFSTGTNNTPVAVGMEELKLTFN